MALAVRTAIRLSSSYAFSSDARSDCVGGRYGLRGCSVCGIMDFDVPIWAICFLDIVGESPILQPASQSGAGCPFLNRLFHTYAAPSDTSTAFVDATSLLVFHYLSNRTRASGRRFSHSSTSDRSHATRFFPSRFGAGKRICLAIFSSRNRQIETADKLVMAQTSLIRRYPLLFGGSAASS